MGRTVRFCVINPKSCLATTVSQRELPNHIVTVTRLVALSW